MPIRHEKEEYLVWVHLSLAFTATEALKGSVIARNQRRILMPSSRRSGGLSTPETEAESMSLAEEMEMLKETRSLMETEAAKVAGSSR